VIGFTLEFGEVIESNLTSYAPHWYYYECAQLVINHLYACLKLRNGPYFLAQKTLNYILFFAFFTLFLRIYQ